MAEPTPTDAVELLEAGNARFVGALPARAPFRFGPATSNRPFAIVLGCSDARVPVEIVFDQVPGTLFVVRVAGNFVDGAALGSIEFAVHSLKPKLILVLGHEDCGAVAAALAYVRDGVTCPGFVQQIARAVAPAVEGSRGVPGNWYVNAIAHNVELNIKALIHGSRIVADAVDRGDVRVVGGIYSVRTGRVAFS